MNYFNLFLSIFIFMCMAAMSVWAFYSNIIGLGIIMIVISLMCVIPIVHDIKRIKNP